MSSSQLKSVSSSSLHRQVSKPIKPSEYQSQLNHFPKSISTNDDSLFTYIKYLVSGPTKDQKNYNQYIFNHLKNTIDHQFNTIALRNTCKFIMTLILLGNFHIYQNIVKYLVPSMVSKIQDQISRREGKRTNQIKPVWHLDEFCMQTFYVLADWLPQDFHEPSKPSIFAKIKSQFNLQITSFKYFNMDKIVFCYRVIKELGINNLQHQCYKCDSKTENKNKKHHCKKFKQKFQEKSMLQNNFLKENKRNRKDVAWQIGIQNLQTLQQVTQQLSSSQIIIKTNQDIKIQSKHQMNPELNEILNNKQLLQKQEILKNKMSKVRQDIRQVQKGVYHIQQKRKIGKYLIKNNINLNIPQEKESENIVKKRVNLISVKSMKQFSSIGLLPTMDRLPILSPRQKKVQKPVLIEKTQNQNVFGYLQTFKKYLGKKSESFVNKFKIALLCPKATIRLKNYQNGSTLKCKIYPKNIMLKVKIYNETQAIKIDLVNPKKCLKSIDSNETQVKMIFNYKKSDKNQLKFQPISIKVDDQQMYLPVGYWHLVKQSSKFMTCNFDKSLIDKKQELPQNENVILFTKKYFVSNGSLFRSLKQLQLLLINQFTQLKQQILENNASFFRIRLDGQIANIKFRIELSKQDNRKIELQNNFDQIQKVQIKGFIVTSKETDFIQCPQKVKQFYINALIQQLIFVLSKDESQN